MTQGEALKLAKALAVAIPREIQLYRELHEKYPGDVISPVEMLKGDGAQPQADGIEGGGMPFP